MRGQYSSSSPVKIFAVVFNLAHESFHPLDIHRVLEDAVYFKRGGNHRPICDAQLLFNIFEAHTGVGKHNCLGNRILNAF